MCKNVSEKGLSMQTVAGYWNYPIFLRILKGHATAVHRQRMRAVSAELLGDQLVESSVQTATIRKDSSLSFHSWYCPDIHVEPVHLEWPLFCARFRMNILRIREHEVCVRECNVRGC
jgi:hypothetical protein